MFNISQEDMGTLCICAIRYCQGRKTYMPLLVQRIVISLLPRLSDKDIICLLQDCDYQKKYDLYGDHALDKPDWILFEKAVTAEKERRKGGKGKR